MSDGLYIVVLGAGLIGLSTADRLLAAGASVTVIEARSGPVRGASHSNGGMIHPSQSAGYGTPQPNDPATEAAASAVLDLARRSRERLRDRMESLGLAEDLSRPVGGYQLFPDIAAARTAQARHAHAGVRANVVVDPVRTFGRPALYFPDDRSADARTYGEALAADLAARGATLIYDAPDVRLRQSDGGVAVALGEHRFRADHVVVACGAQSVDVLAQLGLALTLEPVRGWSVDFDVPSGPGARRLPPMPVMDAASRSAFTPFGDTFRLSGTWGEETARPLLARWAEIIPDVLADAGKPRAIWSGLRPVSPAGRPYISATSVPSLWLNTGHGHLGWTLCAESGELMARMILDGWQDPRFSYAG